VGEPGDELVQVAFADLQRGYAGLCQELPVLQQVGAVGLEGVA
jgi:hypothetical protein